MKSMHRQFATHAVFVSAHDAHLDEGDLVAIINACGTLRGEAAYLLIILHSLACGSVLRSRGNT
jgi:hypothetical protein